MTTSEDLLICHAFVYSGNKATSLGSQLVKDARQFQYSNADSLVLTCLLLITCKS